MESKVKMEADSDDVVFIKCERSMVSDEVNLLSPVSTKMPKPIKLLPSPVKPPQKAAKRNVSLDNLGAATESLVITREVSLEPSNIKLVVNINTSTCHHKERKHKKTHRKSKKEVPKASSDQSVVAFVPQVPKKKEDIHHKERKCKRTDSKSKKKVPKASSDQSDEAFVPQVSKKSEDIPKPVVLNRIVPKCLRRKCLPVTMKCRTRTEGTRRMRVQNNNNDRKCSHNICRERSKARLNSLRRKCHEDISKDRRHKRNRSRSPREKRRRKEDREISLSLSPISLGSIDGSKISYDEITSDNFSTNSEDELDILIKRTKKRESEMLRKQWSNKTERGFRPIRSPLPFAEIRNASTPKNFDENSDATIFSSDMDVTIHSLSTVVLDHHVDLEAYSPTMNPNECLHPRACPDDTVQLNATPQINELEDRDAMKIKTETYRHKENRLEASGLETKNIKRETHRYSNEITLDNFSTNSEDELDTLIKRTKKRESEMLRKQWSNKTERGFRPIRSPLPFAEIRNASTPKNFDQNSDATIFSSDMDVTIHSLSTVDLDHHVVLEVYSPTMSPNDFLCPRACLDDNN